ncbi:hypothetical protein CGZ91_01430 [Parenemella sanctibonifatiensis]|uniref:Fe(3+)-siderophore ABC transporter permease n=1 Tax=Parenemella sanctibonifatiensis TaxID=2016505 RepID=A0A255EKX8_9ACTN|nr:hypothetical protein CGZ91_01430 [Parenemella sanctibonifatiensis]
MAHRTGRSARVRRRHRLVTLAPTLDTAAQSPADIEAAASPTAQWGRRILWAVLLTAGLVAASLLSIGVGERPIDAATTWQALTSRIPGDLAHDIVWDWRLPRTLAGLLVGAAMAVAGALIQAVTRNPLADPGILGVNAGGTLAMAVGATLGIASMQGQLWTALIGALVATVAVHAIGMAGGTLDPGRVTLAGVALAAVLSGLTTGVTLLNPHAFDTLRYWSVGSLSARGMDSILMAMPLILVGLLLALVVCRSLNAIALGDDLAVSLGARVQRTRIIAVIAVTLTCGAATAVAGPIGFIGLMVPHLLRWLIGPNQGWILALSLLAGPTLLLSADVLGRVIITGGMPVGIVTAFIGAPVLIAMSRRRGVSGL